MAGSNQAQPLTGLLQSLTGAFNQEDMGQGMMFAQNLRDYNAPRIDTENPQSLFAYADWASKNGDHKTAQAYQMAGGKLIDAAKTQTDQVELVKMQGALREMERQRQVALSGAATPEEAASINANFDQAALTLANRIDEFAVSSRAGGTGTEGNSLLAGDIEKAKTDSAARRAAVNIASNNPDLVQFKDGLESGAIPPKEFLQSVTGSIGGQSTLQGYKTYENGLRVLQYKDGSIKVVDAADNTYTGAEAQRMIDEAVKFEQGMSADQDWNEGEVELVLDQIESIEDKLVSMDDLDLQYERAETILEQNPDIDLTGLRAELPALDDGRRQLQALQTEMAISLAGMASLGVLSDSDIRNLQQASIPPGSNASMRQFIAERRAALAKVRAASEDMVRWMRDNQASRDQYKEHLRKQNSSSESYGVLRSDQTDPGSVRMTGEPEKFDLGGGVSFTVTGGSQ
jgi:hypothetical protein